MASDEDRRGLYQALEHSLGARPATTLMELLPPVGWADVARRSDLAAIRGEMGELRGEMGELRGELRAEMADLRTELRGEMAALRVELKGEMAGLRTELRGEMAGLRVELTSAIDQQFVRLVLAFIPMIFATALLVLAATKL